MKSRCAGNGGGWILVVSLFLTLAFRPLPASSTPPPPDGQELPAAIQERLATFPQAFQFRRALFGATERAAIARQLASQPDIAGLPSGSGNLRGALAAMLGAPAGSPPPLRVQGLRRIPVILLDFPESGTPAFSPAALKQELFVGPWPTGTLHDYYTEISNGALDVQGEIEPWVHLKNSQLHYAGADFIDSKGKRQHCYGICSQGKIGDLIRDALDANPGMDWRNYDNDGPDDKPNTADDDGFVDFVAFVHAGKGGECGGAGNANIWSHRGSLSLNLGLPPYVTKSPRAGGGNIKIDDYVVFPALACDGSTMIPIGVIAHEFGHAFGLPDLYAINGSTNGLGNWDLMATGAWGGDNVSPNRPTHMSAWSKDRLGWIQVEDVHGSQLIDVHSIENSHKAFRVRVSQSLSYLISARARTGFDGKLPVGGLEVLLVNDSAVNAGLPSNTVNNDYDSLGVKLIEADGLENLRRPEFRGGPGDLYPGSAVQRAFDQGSRPASVGSIALCAIPDSQDPMAVSVAFGATTCAAGQLIAAQPVAVAPPAPASSQVMSGVPPAVASAVAGAEITLRGKLLNLGANFFDRKSRRIVLVDPQGREVEVSTTLPLSGTPGASAPTGTFLSEYLGKNVELKGSLEKIDATSRNGVKVKELKVIP